MAQTTTWRARRINYIHRVHARRAARTPMATVFVSPPEPRMIGIVAKGRQLMTGNFLFSGLLVEGPHLSVWDIAHANALVADEIHRCAWLDDLAAVGDEQARVRAQKWIFQWIKRYGDGKGPGWTPDVVGPRLIRWINHGVFLLRGQDHDAMGSFFQSAAQQALFLSQRWHATPHGLPRFEALVGMIYAGLSLDGMAGHVDAAVQALAADCATQIDADGGIATRNPDELLEILTLLNATVQALTDTGGQVPQRIDAAITRIVPTLRALRHADGALARFHGGGRGIMGRLDQALAASGVKALPEAGLHMGFARLTGGRTSVIVDAAAPPTGEASDNAHASTLAFELTSGRRPLIVNCGSGARFGDEWHRASRATPSHTTLGIAGVSSSRLASPARLLAQQEWLLDVPDVVYGHMSDADGDRKLELSHNGYRARHGLTHARILQLSVDGRRLLGEDLLATLNPDDEARFDKVRDRTTPPGIPFAIRFHLHPDVEAMLDDADGAVFLTLKSGEVWVFRDDGAAELTLAPSVYLQNGRLRPHGAQQVVLSGRTMAYATRVRWSLAKALDTPQAVRDLVRGDPLDSDID
ncbi:heparinase II/III family protein [Yoonia sp.]|uniref:heparinase II/III family protein n=1 Tax=Yoonia sp. TaxID=2212373 RepID=UPI0025D17A3F|nr:heparinase II/III family protein [Yoonia sp.]